MQYGRGLSVAIAATLLACTAARSEAPAPEAVAICSSYGFAAGSPSLAACAAKLDPLARAGETNRTRCEGIRQQAPAATTTGGFPTGIGTSVGQSDAAYRLCLSERVPPPVQLQLPGGRTVTCQLVETHIQCY
jgi:hypothetical protein